VGRRRVAAVDPVQPQPLQIGQCGQAGQAGVGDGLPGEDEGPQSRQAVQAGEVLGRAVGGLPLDGQRLPAVRAG